MKINVAPLLLMGFLDCVRLIETDSNKGVGNNHMTLVWRTVSSYKHNISYRFTKNISVEMEYSHSVKFNKNKKKIVSNNSTTVQKFLSCDK